MGKNLSIIIGGIATVTGLILLMAWWSDILVILKAAVPPVLILGGAIALLAGFAELKDTLKSKK
jgi:hypothetical protein